MLKKIATKRVKAAAQMDDARYLWTTLRVYNRANTGNDL